MRDVNGLRDAAGLDATSLVQLQVQRVATAKLAVTMGP